MSEPVEIPVVVRESEAERIVRWRLQRLLELGLDYERANERARVLGAAGVDLHRFEALRRAGCPPELADEILR